MFGMFLLIANLGLLIFNVVSGLWAVAAINALAVIVLASTIHD